MDRLTALGVAWLAALCVDIVVAVALALSWRIANKIVGSALSANRRGWRDMRRWRRVIARVGLGVVALIPLVLLNGRLLAAPSQTGPFSAHSSVPNEGSAYDQGCPAQQNVITLTIHSTDVVQDTVEVDVALCVGDQTLQQLTPFSGSPPPFTHGIPQNARNISADVLRAAFTVVYDGTIPAQGWMGQASIDQIITLPSISVSNPGLPPVRQPIPLGTLTLRLSGNAGDYPLDAYYAQGSWWLLMPNGMYLSGSPDSIASEIPVTTSILTSPGEAELNWRSYVYYVPNGVPTSVVLQANRSFSNQLFIGVLILLPLLLFIGMLWTFRSRAARQSGDDARLPPDLLIGVGTFLLAVFPIRTVLVPSDVSRLTIVDYGLGTEMAVIVAGTLWLALAVSERSAPGAASTRSPAPPLSDESKESPSGEPGTASSHHPTQENATTVPGEGRPLTDGKVREDAFRMRLLGWLPGWTRPGRPLDKPSDGGGTR
jgi:hypothetical protein